MTSQSEFHSGLLDPDAPLPNGLSDANGAPAGKRYDVYRNNVTQSLIEAMRTAFPLVSKLLGAQNFDRLALVAIRKHPPTSQLMMFYGADFPDFIKEFSPLSHIGYLADAARLDLAMRTSYHSADSPALDPEAFQNIQPDELQEIHLTPCPATIIIRSNWPLFDIWKFNFKEGAAKPRAIPQDVMITRNQFDPEPVEIPSGTADWMAALAAGCCLGDAVEQTLSSNPNFDLTAALTVALRSHAFTQSNGKDLK